MKKRVLFGIIVTLILVGTVFSCKESRESGLSKASYSAYDDGVFMEEAMMLDEFDMAMGSTREAKATSSGGSMLSSKVENLNVKLIYRANLTVQTLNYSDSYNALCSLVDEYGGYFESVYQYNGALSYTGHPYGNYSIRIPSESYTSFINRVSEESHLVDINQSVEDVSLAYSDVENRLETLNTKHERLINLLSSAEKMEDIISLENALSDCESEIDSYTSKKRNYDSLIGYSTIKINLNEVERLKPPVPEKPLTFGEKIINGLKNSFTDGVDFFASIIIWFFSNIIGIIIFCGIVVLIVFLIIKLKKLIIRKKSKIKNVVDKDNSEDITF